MWARLLGHTVGYTGADAFFSAALEPPKMCKQQVKKFIISFLGMDLSQVEMLEVEPVHDREGQQVRNLNKNISIKDILKKAIAPQMKPFKLTFNLSNSINNLLQSTNLCKEAEDGESTEVLDKCEQEQRGQQ